MEHDAGKIIIIGGGIAGLCTAVYARRCGYQVEVLEMHDSAGGLATSWHRGDFTFETCLHWLLGSNPNREMYSRWLEVFDIDKLTFIYPDEFVRLETERGECLRIYSNVDRLEAELLKRGPEDAGEVRHLASAIRSLSKFRMPDLTEGWAGNWLTLLHDVPYLPLLRELSSVSSTEYGKRFTDPLLRSFFGEGDMGQLSALALFFSLAWMNSRDAGYPIGGSQAVIQNIAQKLGSLGGRLRLGVKVERILVEDDAAVGVQLVCGESIAADWVISAADGHATIYDLLGGKYRDKTTEKIYDEFKTFPSYLQVSLGVARDLSQQPGFVTRLLDTPLQVDPGTQLRQVSFRFFHFDPTFAPAGKTAVTCFLPTRNFEFWVQLQQHNPVGYEAEKQRIAEAVLSILERSVRDVRREIEVVDVSTPATVIRYTGNWKGSMEGWLLTPDSWYRQLPNTLPGLRQFLMVGQWVMPGGGLPSGLMTSRSAIQAVCKQDRTPFAERHPVMR
ncbi:phytoene desaturase family protein [Edaphobacter aggregans]|uniref:phytoene desaturase family protein n=1 Tax=Edaphobacter aggregans TaxID=570835 RepID=UPI00055662B6|nr:NAD(P)/FAD-dependent oxidoreductase [Edaphobacter aggregans]